jgi:hypothetical protein
MRDWLLILTPIIIALYFLFNPDQFRMLTDWVGNLLARRVSGASRAVNSDAQDDHRLQPLMLLRKIGFVLPTCYLA